MLRISLALLAVLQLAVLAPANVIAGSHWAYLATNLVFGTLAALGALALGD